ncbi:PIR protein CIR protein [Plasmodium vinckei vinckei]|uniref:PIR protein CIR protein n=1 Tax=Plasmodium vinckei vinckei TaxID=54757 RepID=A0A449BMC8_PLAVN|nr:PIR protein CIR protein [Plasmodium vinckei vinckei]VEV54559.1 PIR protein CIR protein [Plasmodium vinckei vinckei]
MASSPYSIEDYLEILMINDYFAVNNDQLIVNNKNESIHNYCHSWRKSGKDNCDCYFQLASCGFIYLLEKLKKYVLEDDKLAQYATLWLSFKLNSAPNNCGTNLIRFYTNYIEKNDYYNKKIKVDGLTYKKIIDKIKNLMDIKEIYKFNIPFYRLFLSYLVIYSEKLFCEYFSNYPKTFVSEFKSLNNDPKNIKDSPFSQILSTLSNDYDNLKNKYGKNKCVNFPDLPPLNPKKIIAPSPEATSSSSSILNTVIPGLSISSVILVFLGVAYKTIYKKKIKKNKEENET